MEHRKICEEIRVLNYINVNKLNLNPYLDIIKKVTSFKSGEDKLLYMTTYLENNIEIIDIFSNLYYQRNNANILNDLDKYFILYICSLLDKDVMKKYFN